MKSPPTTDHDINIGDARNLDDLSTDSVELVVTSPPYPMVEMWDDLFGDLNPEIERLLEAGDGQAAFEAMHAELSCVWAELERVLVPGGIACINIGDATRSIDNSFRQFPNHAQVLSDLREQGFQSLPSILWHKPTNSPAKFVGSGTLPPNQYVTLEHEHILIVRNGPESRSFEPHADDRYESAYFYEERNQWFSELWTDVRGVQQALSADTGSDTSVSPTPSADAQQEAFTERSPTTKDADQLRDRSAAYPIEIPFRLICMYSAYGDTVLDPFWGTGTTSLAALIATRNSIGYEYDPAFRDLFAERVTDAPALSEAVARDRLAAHEEFVVESRSDNSSDFAYSAVNYDFPVKTKATRNIQLYAVESVEEQVQAKRYTATHRPIEARQPDCHRLSGSDTAVGSLDEQTTLHSEW